VDPAGHRSIPISGGRPSSLHRADLRFSGILYRGNKRAGILTHPYHPEITCIVSCANLHGEKRPSLLSMVDRFSGYGPRAVFPGNRARNYEGYQ